MGKNDNPKVTMTRTPTGWVGASAYDAERLAEYGVGAEVEVTLHQRRSNKHNSLYWVVLALCVQNSECKYGSTHDLHRMLKVCLGYTRKIKLLVPSERAPKATIARQVLQRCYKLIRGLRRPSLDWLLTRIEEADALIEEFEMDCQEITLAGSTAFDAMDQAGWKIYFERAMEQLRLAGYPVDEYISESQKQLASNRPVRSGPYQRGAQHALSEGAAAP
jgi:hypothetical protein